MKTALVYPLIAALAGFAAGGLFFPRGLRLPAERAAESADARARREVSPPDRAPGVPAADSAAGRLRPEDDLRNPAASAREILARLAGFKVDPNEPRQVRRLLVELERLREAGPAALPAIREFLARGDDVDYDPSLARSPKGGKMPTEFAVPPSLRLGLLEVARSIGGQAGENVLLETLRTTGRGVEAAYAAAALQEGAPDKHRDAALAAARDLLGMPLASKATNALDRADREYLYGLLSALGDRTYVERAKADIVQPGGRVDPAALRFLQQTLGEQSVAIAAQTWRDPRLGPEQKEPLARLALNYVGTSADALQLWQLAINDPLMPKDARRNLIEDLNQDGLGNPKKATTADLPLIQQRIALVEQLLPLTTDPVNVAAFKEAHKDLVAMRAKLVAPARKP